MRTTLAIHRNAQQPQKDPCNKCDQNPWTLIAVLLITILIIALLSAISVTYDNENTVIQDTIWPSDAYNNAAPLPPANTPQIEEPGNATNDLRRPRWIERAVITPQSHEASSQ
ncbi:hypothetical protein KS4_03010 [Poriferisphaera corsica]|uniref:Uncharacterized protein n=1 Tax=Poriferisphaera corsica TaxID=2528020 RepID=A0A517YPX9_9BACT|nr:hypothetical protein [Poriferisphaera corsica]QDU32270.1 hypothetical protein KS4_03010 [Poriferisphaera corsica]